ncbi:MAG: type II secretion system protein GspG [Selenomonadaceae bacterium]|nr:type II secretion system protein GspG [Selenomonadaceae bacterium]
MNQRGFATLEVILMVMVIGILASIAVPRFTSVTTAANTAKIQSDLSTIDTAISIYYMEKGTYPQNISDLSDYLKDIGNVKPPTGKAYINGTATDISATSYAIQQPTSGSTDEARATLDGKTSGEFTNKTKTT